WDVCLRLGDGDRLFRPHVGQCGTRLVDRDARTMTGALYICYFGLREPLVQTQVLPYLRALAAGGTRMSLRPFEPGGWRSDDQREQLRREGIDWYALPYHKAAPAKIYDIVRGAFRAAAIARRNKIQIFHGRSHVGTAIGALA